MIYFAYFILLFSIVQLIVALVNYMTGRIQMVPKGGEEPCISVLIPARNEERNIGGLLESLLRQDYQNMEIIVYDDQSADRTGEIIREYSYRDSRVRVLAGEELPEGWLGKNHACHRLAQQAGGDYYLFLDADVRIGEGIIRSAVFVAEKKELGLLSIFPRQIIETPGEKSTVPLMNFILLSLLPLALIFRTGFRALAAANGQFMLFNASVYRKYNPHLRFRNSKVEDIAIARFLKSENTRIATFAGNQSVSCRMYSGFTEAINGFSRNIVCYFGNFYSLAFSFWVVTTLGFFLVFFYLSLPLLLFYLAIILLTRMVISVTSMQSTRDNFLYIFPQQAAMGMMIYKSYLNSRKKQFLWKDRIIS